MIKGERAAAVDAHRDLGGQSLRQAAVRQRVTHVGGQRAGVDQLVWIESGERTAQHRNTILGSDAKRGNG